MWQTNRSFLAKLAFLIAIMVVEVSVLTIRFDKPDLIGVETWWAGILFLSSYVPQWGLTAFMAMVILGSHRLSQEMTRTLEQASQLRYAWWAYFLAHLVAFGIFAQLTTVTCREEVQYRAFPGLMVATWVGVGVLAAVFWCAATLPISVWISLMRRNFGVVLGGAALGMTAWLVSRLTAYSWMWRDGLLRIPTLWTVSELFSWFSADVVFRPELPRLVVRVLPEEAYFVVDIGPFCSSYEGFGLIWVLAVAYLCCNWRRLQFPHALLLIPLATLMMWFVIMFRLFVLTLLPLWLPGNATERASHSQMTWFVLAVLSVGFILSVGHFFKFEVAAARLNNLASWYCSKGRYLDAERVYLRALTMVRRAVGEAHSNFARILHHLAWLYHSMGRYDEAEPLYQQALDIRRKTLGNQHLDVADTLNDLAGLYDSQGRYQEAEPLNEEALQVRQSVLGEDHVDVAVSLNNLAAIYDSLGRNHEAASLYERALDICRATLDEDHTLTALARSSLDSLRERISADSDTLCN